MKICESKTGVMIWKDRYHLDWFYIDIGGLKITRNYGELFMIMGDDRLLCD